MNKLPELDEQRINEAAKELQIKWMTERRSHSFDDVFKAGATSEYFRREEEVRILTEAVKKIDSFDVKPQLHNIKNPLECSICVAHEALSDLEKLRAKK